MRNLHNILFALAIAASVLLSSCSTNEDISSYNTVTYQPAGSCSGSGSGVAADALTLANAVCTILNQNGFDASPVIGSSIIGLPKTYKRTNVANKDTAAVMQELIKEAKSDYTTYIANINNTDLSTDPALKDLVAQYTLNINLTIGGETLSTASKVTFPIIDNTTWACSDAECAIKSISFSENSKCTITPQTGSVISDIDYTRSSCYGIKRTESPAFNISISSASQMTLRSYEGDENHYTLTKE